MNDTERGYALITGASQGLGKAMAEECAGRGINLVLAALPGTGLPEVARLIERTHGVRVEHLEIDLTSDDSSERLLAMIREHGIELSLLINNAGTGYNSRFDASTLGQNDSTIRLNVLSLVRLTHMLLPELMNRGRSYILNVASLGAYFPMPYMPVYSPTKSFILNFSLSIRDELSGSPVHVSVLCPNGIRTNRYCRELIDRQGLAGRLTCQYPDEVARAALDGLFKGKAIIVPGLVNRLLRVVATLVPRSLILRVVRSRWGARAKSVAGGLSPAAAKASA